MVVARHHMPRTATASGSSPRPQARSSTLNSLSSTRKRRSIGFIFSTEQELTKRSWRPTGGVLFFGNCRREFFLPFLEQPVFDAPRTFPIKHRVQRPSGAVSGRNAPHDAQRVLHFISHGGFHIIPEASEERSFCNPSASRQIPVS